MTNVLLKVAAFHMGQNRMGESKMGIPHCLIWINPSFSAEIPILSRIIRKLEDSKSLNNKIHKFTTPILVCLTLGKNVKMVVVSIDLVASAMFNFHGPHFGYVR